MYKRIVHSAVFREPHSELVKFSYLEFLIIIKDRQDKIISSYIYLK